MDLRPGLTARLYREEVRERVAKERASGARRPFTRASARDLPMRTLLARMFLGAAFALDSGEAWRALWDRFGGRGVVGSGPGQKTVEARWKPIERS